MTGAASVRRHLKENQHHHSCLLYNSYTYYVQDNRMSNVECPEKTFLTETRVAIEQGQIRKGKEVTDDYMR
jgi:hypothetical protein